MPASPPSLLAALEHSLEHGDEEAAITLCRERIATQPTDCDAHRFLAQLLSARGEHLAAQRSAMHACALSPHDARCWLDLGRVHARANELEHAVRCFNEALEIDQLNVDAWHNLGLASAKLARDDAAFVALKRALSLDASRSLSWIALGELLLKRRQDADALECFDRAAAHDPQLPRARSRLGEFHLEQGRVTRAEALFRQALAIDPQHPEAWIGLARSLEDSGERNQAQQAYLQLLSQQPRHAVALANYIALLGGGDQPDLDSVARGHLSEAAAALTRSKTAPEAKALVGYALAKHHDKRREVVEAVRAGRIANEARRSLHGALDRVQLAARIDHLIATYDSEFFDKRRRYGIGNDQPVFIVGMPRSGTTLTEQIVSAHPQMHGAGELPDLTRLALRVLDQGDDVWQSATKLTEANSRELAQVYLQALHAGGPTGRRRICDKSPLNFFHLAFAALLFPGARVIHCKRDVRDIALSIWIEDFSAEQQWATDFDDLAFYIAQYQRLMQHWHDVLPLQLLNLEYEDTVVDVERQARRLTEFLGVNWDARCLDFHRSERVVQTPSRWQVRQPIYATSVGRWRAYEHVLPELTSAFE